MYCNACCVSTSRGHYWTTRYYFPPILYSNTEYLRVYIEPWTYHTAPSHANGNATIHYTELLLTAAIEVREKGAHAAGDRTYLNQPIMVITQVSSNTP